MSNLAILISATHTVEFLEKFGIGLKTLIALLVILFAILLPFLASMSSRLIGFYTKSDEEISIMNITIVFLLFMVIIMPVMGFTFGPDLIEFFVNNVDAGFKEETHVAPHPPWESVGGNKDVPFMHLPKFKLRALQQKKNITYCTV